MNALLMVCSTTAFHLVFIANHFALGYGAVLSFETGDKELSERIASRVGWNTR